MGEEGVGDFLRLTGTVEEGRTRSPLSPVDRVSLVCCGKERGVTVQVPRSEEGKELMPTGTVSGVYNSMSYRFGVPLCRR